MLVRVLVLVAALLAGCTSQAPPAERASAASPGATYSVFPPTTAFGDAPRARLRNSGNVPLEYPHEFVLDILEGGVWRTLQATTDPDYACSYDSPAVVYPGEVESQHLTICDGNQRIALVPGTYRVRKTLLTIPIEPGREPVEIRAVAEFDVAEPAGDVRGPDECRVLCMSDTRVEPGQQVRVTFAPPRRYTWGVPSTLHQGTRQTIRPVAFLTAWLDADEEITTHWPGQGGGYEDVGFRGPGSWRWKVPARLEPGIYSIVKDAIAPGRKPVEERIEHWTVSFEVVAARS